MAVKQNQESAKLIINVKISDDKETAVSLSNLNPQAAAEDAYAVGVLLAKLQEYETSSIKRQEIVAFTEE
jgi:hypothetical protein